MQKQKHFRAGINVESGPNLLSTRPSSGGLSSLGYNNAVDRCDSIDFEALCQKPSPKKLEYKMPFSLVEYRFPSDQPTPTRGASGKGLIVPNVCGRNIKQRPWSASQAERQNRSRPQAWGYIIPSSNDFAIEKISEHDNSINASSHEKNAPASELGHASLERRVEYNPTNFDSSATERPWQQRLVFPSERPQSAQPQSSQPHKRLGLSSGQRNLFADNERGPNYAHLLAQRKNAHPIADIHGNLQLVDVLMQMRQQASGRCVQVIDFMRPFDKLRHGCVTFAEFRRCLDLCGCFQLSEEQHHTVQEAFAQVSGTHGCPTARINYSAFCEILQPKTSCTAVADQHRHLVDMLARAELSRPRPGGGSAAACGARRLSHEASQRTLRMVRDLARKVQASRWPVGDVLAGLDPLRRGVVSRPQLSEVRSAVKRASRPPSHGSDPPVFLQTGLKGLGPPSHGSDSFWSACLYSRNEGVRLPAKRTPRLVLGAICECRQAFRGLGRTA